VFPNPSLIRYLHRPGHFRLVPEFEHREDVVNGEKVSYRIVRQVYLEAKWGETVGSWTQRRPVFKDPETLRRLLLSGELRAPPLVPLPPRPAADAGASADDLAAEDSDDEADEIKDIDHLPEELADMQRRSSAADRQALGAAMQRAVGRMNDVRAAPP
jgi:hypothetical protein